LKRIVIVIVIAIAVVHLRCSKRARTTELVRETERIRLHSRIITRRSLPKRRTIVIVSIVSIVNIVNIVNIVSKRIIHIAKLVFAALFDPNLTAPSRPFESSSSRRRRRRTSYPLFRIRSVPRARVPGRKTTKNSSYSFGFSNSFSLLSFLPLLFSLVLNPKPYTTCKTWNDGRTPTRLDFPILLRITPLIVIPLTTLYWQTWSFVRLI